MCIPILTEYTEYIPRMERLRVHLDAVVVRWIGRDDDFNAFTVNVIRDPVPYFFLGWDSGNRPVIIRRS